MIGEKFAEAAQSASSGSPRTAIADSWLLPAKPTVANQNDTLAVPAMSFGPFHVLPCQRLLLEGDHPLRVGSRAFDVLVALVERAGELVSKGEFMARVWPGTFVDESNLKVQIAALRRALRDGEKDNRYILTVPGRGYWFVAPVVRSSGLTALSERVRMSTSR